MSYRIPTQDSIDADLAEKADVVHTHVITDLVTTGTPDDTNFLRGDGQWAVPPGTGEGGGTGVSDHGALSGLLDDDHPQYLNEDRADALYAPQTHSHTAAQVSDATPTGRAVLTASDAAAARTAIGASSLVLGTTSTTAKAGNYTPTKAEVGLGNVDNTSDANKPISTAQSAGLAAKSLSEAIVFHDGTTGGGTRPTGYARVVWVNPVGTNYARPTNMQTGDVWETEGTV